MRTPARIAAILGTATLLAIVSNVVRPGPLPWVIDPSKSVNPGENPELMQKSSISLEEVVEAYTQGTALFVDARSDEEFKQGHLAGAVHIPASEKDLYLERIFEHLPFGMTIVIYCEGGECESSNVVYEFLVMNGFSTDDLRIFQPGWEVLGGEESGLPVEQGAMP
jgi:rhodanese-related sulfurtransferase